MSNSIFDWDDEGEKEPEKPPELLPYELMQDAETFVYNPDPFGTPPAKEVPTSTEQKAEISPAPFEYSSDPFQTNTGLGETQSAHSPDEFDAYQYQAGTREYEQDPFANEANTFVPMAPPLDYHPPTAEETAKGSGMAFSAGIVFFSSVVFMLFLGWIADLLIGSSPWGLVGGIVLGSIIGLVQFVRITSRIFNSKKAEAAINPLSPPDDNHH
jgi:F0F1-type ATP synthase assembly protein I